MTHYLREALEWALVLAILPGIFAWWCWRTLRLPWLAAVLALIFVACGDGSSAPGGGVSGERVAAAAPPE